MTHASDRKQRRKKKKRWQQRGGGGVQRSAGGGPRVRTGAIGKASPFWQVVIGVTAIGFVVLAVILIAVSLFVG